MDNPAVMVPVVAFNLTVMIYALYRVLTHTGVWTGGAAAAAMGIAVLLGLVVGGIAFVVFRQMNK